MDRETSDDVIVDVVTEIAAREGVEPTQLPPLARTIDSDALARLLDSDPDQSVRVEFTYRGYDVNVDSAGSVDVRDVTTTLRE